MAGIPPEKLTQRQAIFEALTGTKSPTAGGKADSVRNMLQNLYGVTRKGQPAVDTREAAKSLNVSQRTIQRWLKNDHTPSPDHLKTIRAKSRQAVTTKRGRARALRRAAATRPPSTDGAKVTVKGTQGPRDYPREGRNVMQKLTPEEHQGLLNAYAEGGDENALRFLEQVFSEKYVDNWHFRNVKEFGLDGSAPTKREDPRSL